MSLAEAVKYVAAAYAVILVVLFVYYLMSARRVSKLQREVELLKNAVDERDGGDGPGA
jgi:CcmD family protein